jgi:hypothetical protein
VGWKREERRGEERKEDENFNFCFSFESTFFIFD